MSTRTVFVEGLGFWAPRLPGWDLARAAFRGDVEPGAPARRPSPELLPTAERRRAPDSVAIALEVAARALGQSGRPPGELLSVFTSAHGDLGITDYMCATLVSAPLLISPTKFHNSVHNAASGYWGIATGSLQASTALSAFDTSFSAGLLEALTQCATENSPVLLVGYDIAATGPLLSTNESRGLLAVALVMAPDRSERSQAGLDWRIDAGPVSAPPLRSAAAKDLANNAMSDALPLFEALAREDRAPMSLPLSAGMTLRIEPH